jgi:hypothetical protein
MCYTRPALLNKFDRSNGAQSQQRDHDRFMSSSKRQQFLLLIIIIKLILLKIRVRTGKFQIYEWQRATVSGADETRHWQC